MKVYGFILEPKKGGKNLNREHWLGAAKSKKQAWKDMERDLKYRLKVSDYNAYMAVYSRWKLIVALLIPNLVYSSDKNRFRWVRKSG